MSLWNENVYSWCQQNKSAFDRVFTTWKLFWQNRSAFVCVATNDIKGGNKVG